MCYRSLKGRLKGFGDPDTLAANIPGLLALPDLKWPPRNVPPASP
jgi:hypothetical protein